MLDPWAAEYLGVLGDLYLKAGMRVRARKAFEEAKAIDPGFTVPKEGEGLMQQGTSSPSRTA